MEKEQVISAIKEAIASKDFKKANALSQLLCHILQLEIEFPND